MNDRRHRTLLKILSQGIVYPDDHLENELNVSNRTLRTLIKEVNHSLLSHGAEIERRRGIGYQLKIYDETLFLPFFEQMESEGKSEELIPATPSERVPFLLGLLLQADRYIKLEEVSDMLYISTRVISDDLKEVEQILESYGLKLVRKANYGVRIIGEEPNFRRCLIECVFENRMRPLRNDAEQELNKITGLVRECVERNGLIMSEIAIKNLVIHIYAAVCRVRDLHFAADYSRFDRTLYEEDFQIAGQIAKAIKKEFEVDFPESEIDYITVRLAGLQTLNETVGNENNLIITQEISDLVTEMLKKVKEAFQIDFTGNLELRMSLSQHIVPMQIRIQFGLKLKNPLLLDIKKRFALAYAVAAQACTAVNQHFHTQLSDDEIGYVALIFALALESRKKKPEGKNILVVCGTGKGSASLLKYKYQQEFGDYIRHIEICDVGKLNKINFQDFDYVFTTVSIPVSVPVVIQEVGVFLGKSDISRIKRLLSDDSCLNIRRYVFPELFLTGLEQNSKKDVLRMMCDITMQQGFVKHDFYESVMKRERLASTDYGELVAMPHPDRCVSKKTFVCVGILKKPVFWGKQNVQVVFLMAISDRPDQGLQMFYQTIARFLLNEKQIRDLIQKQDYQEFLHQLGCVEEEIRNGGN